jgi:hypothetical protein
MAIPIDLDHNDQPCMDGLVVLIMTIPPTPRSSIFWIVKLSKNHYDVKKYDDDDEFYIVQRANGGLTRLFHTFQRPFKSRSTSRATSQASSTKSLQNIPLRVPYSLLRYSSSRYS